MAPATRARRKAPRRAPARPVRPPTAGWWGDGSPPWERWPRVSIRLDAEWSHERHRWESPCGVYYYDQGAADRAVDFFPEFLKHHIGEFAGQPFRLMDYQQLLLTRPIFGWKRVADGLRRFRRVFSFLPKGAGKSPWGSGTGVYCTLCDGEAAAEVYAVAADKNQARVVHDNARIMVEESPDLLEMCEVLRDAIYHPESRSTYKVLSSDASTKHGFRPHAIIFDELHAQKDRKLYEALSKSMKKRRQPLLIMMSHAGDDDEGICAEEYDYAKRVLSGTVNDPTFLPVIFEATSDDDWSDPAVWRRVNPGHGITVQHDAIVSECEQAKAEPRKLNDFLMYTLNRWVNQAVAWIPIDWWDRCAGAVDEARLAALPCYAGLDMSQKYDLTALVLAFPEPLEGTPETIAVPVETETGAVTPKTVSLNFGLTLLPFFWLPADTLLERVKQDRIPYDQWKAAGLLRVTEGGSIDYDRVLRDIVEEIIPRFPRLKEGRIGYDPAFATDIATKLRDRHGLLTVETLQNYKHLSEPAMVFEALVKTKRVRHSGHRILRNHVENVSIKSDDAGRIRPVKPKRQTKRIDGVAASLMAVAQYILNPIVVSVYEERGVLVV